MSSTYLYEFLWRGQPDGSSDYHVILAAPQVNPLTGATSILTGSAMTPTQAEAAGFPLATVIDTINHKALSDVTDLTSQVTTLTTDKAALTKQLEDASNALAMAAQSVTRLTSEREQFVSDLGSARQQIISMRLAIKDLSDKVAAAQKTGDSAGLSQILEALFGAAQASAETPAASAPSSTPGAPS